MKEIASLVNEKKRESENIKKVAELSTKINGFHVRTHTHTHTQPILNTINFLTIIKIPIFTNNQQSTINNLHNTHVNEATQRKLFWWMLYWVWILISNWQYLTAALSVKPNSKMSPSMSTSKFIFPFSLFIPYNICTSHSIHVLTLHSTHIHTLVLSISSLSTPLQSERTVVVFVFNDVVLLTLPQGDKYEVEIYSYFGRVSLDDSPNGPSTSLHTTTIHFSVSLFLIHNIRLR
jgi:hypothetical protein